MGFDPITVAIAGAVLNGVMQASSARKQAKAQEQANQQATAAAQQQAQAAEAARKQAEEEMNKANQKRPNTQAILNAAMLAGRGGASGTMLSGPQGVDAGAMTLGKNSALGA